MLDADSLKLAGIKLYGPRKFINEFATRFNVNVSTVYRWLDGTSRIPGSVEAAVTCWLEKSEGEA